RDQQEVQRRRAVRAPRADGAPRRPAHRPVRARMEPLTRQHGRGLMKIAILGLGSIGRRHLQNFHAVGVETLTGYDSSPEQRAAAAVQCPYLRATATAAEALHGAVRAARTEYAYHLGFHRYPGKDYRQFYMADPKQGGGCLLDESHAIDYMRWLLGEIVEVSAVVDRVSSLEIGTDDVADLTVRFASGAVGNIHMNLFAWNMHSHFELMGEAGVIQWRRMENEVRVYDPRAARWEVYPSTGQLNDMYVEEAKHFLAVIGGRPPRCAGWD